MGCAGSCTRSGCRARLSRPGASRWSGKSGGVAVVLTDGARERRIELPSLLRSGPRIPRRIRRGGCRGRHRAVRQPARLPAGQRPRRAQFPHRRLGVPRGRGPGNHCRRPRAPARPLEPHLRGDPPDQSLGYLTPNEFYAKWVAERRPPRPGCPRCPDPPQALHLLARVVYACPTIGGAFRDIRSIVGLRSVFMSSNERGAWKVYGWLKPADRVSAHRSVRPTT